MGRATHKPDPIFAAIEAHRQVWNIGNASNTPSKLWGRQEERAYAALAKTTPTTLEGISALGCYLQEGRTGFAGILGRPEEIADAITRGVAHISNASPVAEGEPLIALGKKLDDLNAKLAAHEQLPASEIKFVEGEDVVQTLLLDRLHALLKVILTTPADTLEGLYVKLRAFAAWQWDEVNRDIFAPGQEPKVYPPEEYDHSVGDHTSGTVILSLGRDVHRLLSTREA